VKAWVESFLVDPLLILPPPDPQDFPQGARSASERFFVGCLPTNQNPEKQHGARRMQPSARPGHGRHAATILLACMALMVADASCTKVRHLGLRGGQPSDRAAWGEDGVERGRTMETMRDPVYGAGVGDAASSLASRCRRPSRTCMPDYVCIFVPASAPNVPFSA
jgi:hypothetical protein